MWVFFLKNQVPNPMNPSNQDQDNSPQTLLNQIVIEHFKEKKQAQKRRKWRRIFLCCTGYCGCFLFLLCT